jgi:hypothetical protein
MSQTVVLHLQGEEPVVGEIEDFPKPTDRIIVVYNPRRLDGKDLHYLAENVNTVIWPMSRMNFIEILPTKEQEEIIGFVRE